MSTPRLSLPAAFFAAAVLLTGSSTSQTITIQSVPPGAQITVDGTPRGTAPVKVRLLTDAFAYIGVHPFQVVASKPGYRDKRATLQPNLAFFSNPHPFPDPLVMEPDGQPSPAPAPAPANVGRTPAPAAQPPSKKESWR